MDIYLNDVIAPNYDDALFDVLYHKHTHYIFKGGRGSCKSSFISIAIIILLTRPENKDVHCVVFRKTANTLRDSVFSQLLFAISKLGLEKEFVSTVNPMRITYKKTGQTVIFRGVDDKLKIKSIKAPFGYFGITWLEECDTFCGMEEIRNILQSTMRGGPKYWVFMSFNPPRTAANFMNEEVLNARADRLVHSSDYRTVPVEWLGEHFFDEAEYLKKIDLKAYEHEYLGIANGTGGNVFDNLELREISDGEIAGFDRIYQGIDWGWYPDPFAFIRLHYDKARETIYFIDEIYQNKLTNEASAKIILERGYKDAYITCDSAEPKSAADYRAMRLPAQEAVKGPGSVDYGMKWLQRRKIVIDRRRTPHAFEEFVNYQYERNKDGDIISGYPDADNHLIDATRYALERAYRRMGVTA